MNVDKTIPIAARIKRLDNRRVHAEKSAAPAGPRLQAAYAATAAVLMRAAVRVSAPAKANRLRHVLACVAAAVPALCVQPAWADGRRALVAVCAAAAPLGYALASHVDADMRSLGADVAALDGARYKHKEL